MKTVTCLALLAMTFETACSGLPSAGPTRSQIVDQARAEGQPAFALVELDDRVIAALSNEPGSRGGLRALDRGKPTAGAIGIGDSVAVTLWQSISGNIFGDVAPGAAAPPIPPSGTAAAGAQSITIPEQAVGARGTITIPFIGAVNVAGRTAGDVQRDIEARLRERAFHPQAIVTVTKNVSDSVTISGEGMTAGHIPLSSRGDRLLDVIATDGGAKSEPFETVVRLTRAGKTATVPLSRLMSDPAENIHAWPGDVITLLKQPRTFAVFGATQSNTQIAFDADRVDLAQAIAKAGGLQDARADPSGVFLFRFEPAPVAAALGLPGAPDSEVRVVYHLDLAKASSYFLARRFAMRDDDILYSANAPLDKLQKFFTLVGAITSPTIGGVVVTRSVAGGH